MTSSSSSLASTQTVNRPWNICHLTSVHSRNDTRIFIKQCRSLVAHGYFVTMVVADGRGDAYKDGVKIVDVGCLPGRLNRMFKTTLRVLKKSVEIDADLYHLHDPELIPVGMKLKRLGKKVIFDAHEDVPKQLLGKPYLNPLLLRILSEAFSLFEHYACPDFDGIITATPFIRDKFLAINPSSVDINNYPVIGELDANVPWTDKRDEICYVGGIGLIRGIREVIHACNFLQTPARLNLTGCFSEPAVKTEVKGFPGWSRVNELGFVDRIGVREVLGRSMAGLVTFHPLPNHVDSQPNKMFEYMSAGVPVIASDFPLWREIVEGNDCGLCVNPFDTKAIAAAIDFMINNPVRARQMGENGQHAVLSRYNWAIEEAKLLNFYKKLEG